MLENIDHSVNDLIETFNIFPYNVQSTQSSPRRSDSKSLSDVKRDLANIARLQRTGHRLLNDCRESDCLATAIKVLDDANAFEAIFQELHLWWSDMWSILEQILGDYGAEISGGRYLPGFSGKFWKYFLQIAADKDREEARSELQEIINTLALCQWDEVNIRHLKRARLLCGKLGYSPGSVNFMYVPPSDLEQGRLLGSGSYGEVHEVIWCGEKYAMKTFKGANSEMFVQEASIHAYLQHPYIVKMICHSSNEVENTCSLVIELMDENLSSFIAKAKRTHYNTSPFKPFIAVRILLQIADAMQYLHSKDIMHRDLKAENVLVCHSSSIDPFVQDFQVKVADFGMAKSKASSSDMNTSKVGTSFWRAPEVMSIELTSKYSFKADVYSFAFTCYEVLTGKTPFVHYNKQSLYEKIKMGERPDIPDFVYLPLATLIKRCWQNDPNLRPTFKEIHSELQKCLIDASGYEWIATVG